MQLRRQPRAGLARGPGWDFLQLCLQLYLGGTGLAFGEKRIRCQGSRARSIVPDISAGSDGDHHKLFFRFSPQVGQRRRVPVEFKFRDPKLFPRLRIECPKAMIGSGADEDQPPGGHD